VSLLSLSLVHIHCSVFQEKAKKKTKAEISCFKKLNILFVGWKLLVEIESPSLRAKKR
jgi:hypothetical protein